MKIHDNGFTLLETIIAVAILATAIVASLALISKSIQSVSISQNRLIASYLSHEGIEIVRNIRDNNWKNGRAWDEGWTDCANCEIDYTLNTLADGGDPFLKIDNTNFYNYNSGTDTKFKRRITVSSVNANQKRIISQVVWDDRGKNFSAEVEGFFYNWQ